MTARVVIHQDDVGMCHGANVAFVELARLGHVTSGSVMVPCPWFTEIAEPAAADPTLDLGVHLTLTAEKAHYRWRPLTRRRRRPGSPTRPATCGATSPACGATPTRRRSRPSCGPRSTGARRGHRRHPPRRPHGRRAGAGVRRHVPPARRRVPAAGAAHRDAGGVRTERPPRRRDRGRVRRASSTGASASGSRSSTRCGRRRGTGPATSHRLFADVARRADVLRPPPERARRARGDRAGHGAHPHRGVRAAPRRGRRGVARAETSSHRHAWLRDDSARVLRKIRCHP